MTIFVTFLHVFVCFVLIVVILVQGGRGQGLSGPSFSSGNVQSLLGTQAADFFTKATSVSAILFLFTCIGLNLMESKKSRSVLAGAHETAPVDIDAVRKALAKVAQDKKTPSGGTATTTNTPTGVQLKEQQEQAAQKVNEVVDKMKAATSQPVADVKKEVAQTQTAASASPKS